ncbi:MAG: DUF4738 domain-containing protein [Bacteroidaceae bacterium]|nr:DUF4738 domain-containing protein [Bacteroidaceae bacterium]
MKSFFHNAFFALFLSTLAVSLLSACNSNATKEAEDQARASMAAAAARKAKAEQAPIQSAATQSSGAAHLGSKEITYKIARTSLADHIVNTESGKHYDNTVKIDIMSGGSSFFSRSFGKTDFESLIPAQFAKDGILEAIVFEGIKDGKLVFSASVGIPETELYVLTHIFVAGNGSMSLEKQDTLDDTLDETLDEDKGGV